MNWEIRIFFEKAGHQIREINDFPQERTLFLSNKRKYNALALLKWKDNACIYWINDSDGHFFSEEEMLRIIKLKAFI